MSNYLYHHGILGMKWGKRNGPPYPLGSGDHSISEKKAGWQKSLGNKETTNSESHKGLTDKQKKAIKIGVAVVGTALLAYGGYKLGKFALSKDLINVGALTVQDVVDADGSRIIKAGTKLNSVSNQFLDSEKYKSSGRALYAYFADDEYDASIYKGPFSYGRIIGGGKKVVREHQFETVKDLRVPTLERRMYEFKSLYNKSGEEGTEFRKFISNLHAAELKKNEFFDGGDPEFKRRIKDIDPLHLKTSEDYKKAFELFNHHIGSSWTWDWDPPVQRYIKGLSGLYDAMIDDNNQGIYNGAHNPLIIFKAEQFLKDVSDPSNPRFVSADEIQKNIAYLKVILGRKGERVKF